MVIYLKAVAPSKALADFLSSNTALPYIVWFLILQLKERYENEEISTFPSTSRDTRKHTLRSGTVYRSSFSAHEPLVRGIMCDSNKVIRTLEDIKKMKNSSFKSKLLYNGMINFINYVINWSHYLLQNSNKNHVHKLYCVVIDRATKFWNQCDDVFRKSRHTEYCDYTRALLYDLEAYVNYLECPCGWQSNPANKCHDCKDLEHWFYNWNSYHNNYMYLRNGKRILKPNAFSEPIIIKKVYMLA